MNEQQTPQAQPVSAPVTEPITVTAAQAEPVTVPGTVPASPANAGTVPASPTSAGTVPANPAQPAPAATEPDYRTLYENLRRENEILRQNAEATQRAPVQGVSGGGAVAAPVDDFIRGFDSDTWD
ncbi:MAG: hypothetical protein IKO14_07020 [Oscillibacter sp.]|nr:hypothetical protein [Oscillibacter sp.]